MSVTADCELGQEFSSQDDEWYRKLDRNHARANTLVKKTRARREHQFNTQSSLWWPLPGPVTPKVRRREREDLNLELVPHNIWEESENYGEVRTAARRQSGRCACCCCNDWRIAFVRDASRLQKWTVKMYESRQLTLGRALGGDSEKTCKKPTWVDYEWNIELKDVDLDFYPDYDGDEDVYRRYLPPPAQANLLDLVVATKVPKRRKRATFTATSKKTLDTFTSSPKSTVEDWDVLSLASLEESFDDDDCDWDRLSDVASIY